MRFDDRVVIVTGAGAGLGRAYALDLAQRGAKVVVNGREGEGDGPSKAEKVVSEIKAFGGEAIAFDADVADGARMQALADATLDRWGRIDVLINNAGIERRGRFSETPLDELHQVISINLIGTINATKAVWNAMETQGYGRILMTTSAVGLWGGNHGQTGYGASKLGIVGLAKTLRVEGDPKNIRVNCLIPAAYTDMSAGVLPEDMRAAFSVERVVPAAVALISEKAPSGAIIGAGVGLFHAAWVTMNEGIIIPPSDLSPETILNRWDEIVDPSSEFKPVTGADEAKLFLRAISQ